MQPPTEVISVKEFLSTLNETLSFAFPTVTVEGEVSGFQIRQNKWVSFDLKDEDAKMNCFMAVWQLKTPIEDGMKIRATGNPRIYVPRGQFSFNVKSVSLAGEGELKRAFEILKSKLEKEGLFAAERKRLLPEFPRTIGLVTSRNSAAYADFMKILDSRWGGLQVLVADVQVQGVGSPEQIVAAIEYFNQLAAPPDVLVVIRGGGSLEDLQAFNSEAVARAVAASRAPTIVGVGHEVDTSLADLAADRRAATPTNAAQLVIPDRKDVLADLRHRQTSLLRLIQHQIVHRQHLIARQMTVLERFTRLPAMRLESLQSRLRQAERAVRLRSTQKLEALNRLLASFDPNATLKRGYSIVRHDQRVVTAESQVSSGDKLVIQLAAGKIHSKVEGNG